jgi:hypothetical protein
MTLVESSANIPNEYGSVFNDSVSWVEVLMGPNASPTSKAECFQDVNYGVPSVSSSAPPVDLDFTGTGFNDQLSSVRITA